MNDPSVVALHYVIESGPHGPTYDNPPPVTHTLAEFTLTLRDGRAVATMLVHHARQEEAREVVEPVLTAWEVESALRSGGSPQLQFVFERAEVIDRNPPPPGRPQVLSAAVCFDGTSALTTNPDLISHEYPAPPTIRMNADVETLWFRYSLYKQGRDSLTGMAYFWGLRHFEYRVRVPSAPGKPLSALRIAAPAAVTVSPSISAEPAGRGRGQGRQPAAAGRRLAASLEAGPVRADHQARRRTSLGRALAGVDPARKRRRP